MERADASMNSHFREQPLELRQDEPNETTYAAMGTAASGEDLCGPFDTVDDLMEALNREEHE